jgi:molybdopterin synthase sulfur carrier subunit
MKIEVRYFAGVREALGLAQESLDVPEGVDTVGAVRDFLIRRGEAWAAALGGRRALRMAYNQHMAGPETPIAETGEVAFFPPVTGG